MDSSDDNSCALDNFISPCNDASKLSDTLPSISIDENNGDQDFFLKEHYDKVDRLRKENFDLKLKLYLLESNEKFTNESELKFKVIKEFDKKNEEIKNLKDMLKNQHKMNIELKKILKKGGKESNNFSAENQQLKSKLSEALQICFNLVSQTEDLIKMNRRLAAESTDIDRLKKTVTFIGKASQFLAENQSNNSANENLPENNLNAKKDINSAVQHEFSDLNGIAQHKSNSNNILPQNAIYPSSSSTGEHDHNIDQFMKVVDNLRNLIEDFRANKVTYKIFSTRLDSLFEDLSDKHKLLERLQLDRRESDTRLKTAQRMLKSETDLKERIKADLVKSMRKLDVIISKTKQSSVS